MAQPPTQVQQRGGAAPAPRMPASCQQSTQARVAPEQQKHWATTAQAPSIASTQQPALLYTATRWWSCCSAPAPAGSPAMRRCPHSAAAAITLHMFPKCPAGSAESELLAGCACDVGKHGCRHTSTTATARCEASLWCDLLSGVIGVASGIAAQACLQQRPQQFAGDYPKAVKARAASTFENLLVEQH